MSFDFKKFNALQVLGKCVLSVQTPYAQLPPVAGVKGAQS